MLIYARFEVRRIQCIQILSSNKISTMQLNSKRIEKDQSNSYETPPEKTQYIYIIMLNLQNEKL